MSKSISYVLGALIGLLVVVSIAAASDSGSKEVKPETFEVVGKTCVYYKGQLDCFCPCTTEQCSVPSVVTGTEAQMVTVPQVITFTLLLEDTSAPEETTNPVASTAPEDPEPDPEQEQDPEPDPEQEQVGTSVNDRTRCNQGVGNGAEGCDPGNSNRNQVSNDENGGQPGAPGRAHNDNGGGQGTRQGPKKGYGR